MHILSVVGSYSTLAMALFGVFILYRSQKYKDKGMTDPWKPYLYTFLIILLIFASVEFILRTSHR
jgi:hypothetical protein